MVEIIQRYNLSATAGGGSSILSADIVACLFIAVLNQIRIIHAQGERSPQPSKAIERSPLLPPGDGPFGLEEGLSKKNIEDMTGEALEPVEGSTNLYTSVTLPKKNADFAAYGLLISPSAGLCQIRAVGKRIDTDSFGIALSSKYEDLVKTLTSIYGKAEKDDFLYPGSSWKESEYWMRSLEQQERVLSARWKGTASAPLKSDLLSVSIEARADSSTEGYIYLQYDFKNNDICKSEIEGARKSSL